MCGIGKIRQTAPVPASPNPAAFDVLVVGGGINGTGIARDLAGRGQQVLLCEQDDLAAHTSSSSTKLIHGGLRYLEHGEFALVRKALAERERLMRSAPHIMWPLRFVMPHDPDHASVRPAWLIRLGLFLYDHLARRAWLPDSRRVDLRRHAAGAPLQPRFRQGFIYSDGWVDDARLVVLNAIDAAEHGATVLTRWRCVDAQRGADHWEVTLRSGAGETRHVSARALVNAAGPWAAQFLGDHAHRPHPRPLRLVKGSHIVVRKLFDHDHAYLLQAPDRRVVFAIPYEGEFTLIGTTEVEHHGAIGEAHIDEAEVTYLCEQVSRCFARPIGPEDVVWSYAGVRPLLEDGSGDAAAVTRDYALELDTQGPALLSVWGGKLTTFRKLAEEAADLLSAPLNIAAGAWTATATLPGGDLGDRIARTGRPDVDFARFVEVLLRRHPEVPTAVLRRWARSHGSRVDLLVTAQGLGAEIAPGLFEAELHSLHRHEWARTATDVLWRRTKLGLHLTPAQRETVARWCEAHWGAPQSVLRPPG
ncbi:MAG: glycerol-3-phosphate dehydrogenase [Burkholderiales bacterium PBB1]|nr:MAG: glycerol-3-phosphate dehydrogenase [Burkholderiales bacterium PBB1]